jgi:hypothetical protein
MSRLAPLVATVIFAAACAGSGHSAQLHRHHFLVGKRECAKWYQIGRGFHPTNLPGVTAWRSQVLVQVAISTREVSKPYRRDVVAWCNAAG